MNGRDQNDFDYDYLLSLARQKSTESRARLTEIIVDLFDNQEQVLNERQRALMFGILQSVIDEIEASVRQAVAGRLALFDDVPRDLVIRLANDEIRIAYPILKDSGLLRDSDLIEVIKHRTEEHMLAITLRNTISASVSDALVESGRQPVVISLLKNPNADISNRTMEYLVEQSKRVDSFQEPILRRGDLEPELAKKMLLWVSAALRKHIVDQFNLDRATVDEILEDVTEVEIKNTLETGQRKVDLLAEALKSEGLVTVDMLMTALREGEIPLFVALFSKVTKLREHLVQRLLFEPGGEGLAIACRGIGMSLEEFEQLFECSHAAKAGKPEEIKAQLPSLMSFYSGTPRNAAIDVLKLWHRGSDYLGALRELEVRLRDHDNS